LLVLNPPKKYYEDYFDFDGIATKLLRLTDFDFREKVKLLNDNQLEGCFDSVCLVTHSIEISKDELKNKLKDFGKDIDLLLIKSCKKRHSFSDKLCNIALVSLLEEYQNFIKQYSVQFTLYKQNHVHEEKVTSDDYVFYYVPEEN